MTERANPSVSVVMATYNGARTIRDSIESILSQTHRDLELIVADDGSSDGTVEILEQFDDARLRILRNPGNLGVVASRNRCFEHARGAYVAMLDHDDLSAPTRLARQMAYLDANPGTVLLGTAARVLDGGVLRPMNHPERTTPALICWLLHVANPLVCSSVMFRADAVRRLGMFMSDQFTYADDYEFYHRMATLGAIARLDTPLTIYRLHDSNAYKRHESTMTANAIRVLETAFDKLFGADAPAAARVVVQHLSAGKPVESADELRRLVRVFDTLNRYFLGSPDMDRDSARALLRHANVLWQRLLNATNRQGAVGLATLLRSRPEGFRASAAARTRMLVDHLPLRGPARDLWRGVLPAATGAQAASVPPEGVLFGTPYLPRPADPAGPPRLFVVVDTEAEFDWDKPFARELDAVSAMDDIERGQAVFDEYGLQPIYVVDYPVASQARGFSRLRAIMERHGCVIGAHLHPWTTPPFEEEVSTRNSYPGNLEPPLEERKLATLTRAIGESFGVAPVFYKAGRYGFGPATPAALMNHGIKVDLSVLPGADLRRKHGPDFRRLRPIPYRIGSTSVLTVPMTRADIGSLPQLAVWGRAFHEARGGRAFRVPSFLARMKLAETITLTPEGVTSAEQIRLLRHLLKRGDRQFVLHYHSPSLSPGHTPYARDAAGAETILARLRDVCRFFFEELGGLPGDPASLVAQADAAARPR